MKERMIDLLLSKPLGRIFACNSLAAVGENVLTRKLLKDSLENCVQAFIEDKNNVGTTKRLVGLFEDVARGDRPITSSRRRKFLFASKKRTPTIKNAEFSNVMKVSVLSEHLVSDSALAHSHATFVSNPDPTDTKLKDALDRLNGRTDIYRFDASLGGNLDRPLFWIAPSDILSTVRQNNSLEKLGDIVRDRLGLIDEEEDAALVEIRIPGNRLQRRTHARPTVADAGIHRRFRIRPDANRARRRSGWGWTVDLRRFANGDTIIDGAPERIVEPINFDTYLGAKLEFAGVIKTLRGNTAGDDDEAFAKRICYGVSRSSLKKSLLDIFS